MRVLLISSCEKGHLNPMVGVAQHLMRAGHYVGWLTIPEPAEQLASLGVEVVTLRDVPAAPRLVTGGEALARLVLDAEALRSWIRTLLLDAVPGQVEPVRASIRVFRPDVVALDGMLYQGVIAAHLQGAPTVGVSSALTLLEPPELDFELIQAVRGLAPQRAALFARYGLDPRFRTCEWLSPLLNVIFATDALVGMDNVPPATHLVGPSLPPDRRGDETEFPWERLREGRPLLYVSFGSQISWQPELFTIVAEAAAPLDAQVVLSAGELAATGFAHGLPRDVIVCRYVPQLALLAKAAGFVCHGGANSVMESMSQGVPMLLLPVCNDQPVQAHFMRRAGAGLSLDSRALTVQACRDALREVLDPDGPLRAQARRVQASYGRHDGARRAAELIAGAASMR